MRIDDKVARQATEPAAAASEDDEASAGEEAGGDGAVELEALDRDYDTRREKFTGGNELKNQWFSQGDRIGLAGLVFSVHRILSVQRGVTAEKFAKQLLDSMAVAAPAASSITKENLRHWCYKSRAVRLPDTDQMPIVRAGLMVLMRQYWPLLGDIHALENFSRPSELLSKLDELRNVAKNAPVRQSSIHPVLQIDSTFQDDEMVRCAQHVATQLASDTYSRDGNNRIVVVVGPPYSGKRWIFSSILKNSNYVTQSGHRFRLPGGRELPIFAVPNCLPLTDLVEEIAKFLSIQTVDFGDLGNQVDDLLAKISDVAADYPAVYMLGNILNDYEVLANLSHNQVLERLLKAISRGDSRVLVTSGSSLDPNKYLGGLTLDTVPVPSVQLINFLKARNCDLPLDRPDQVLSSAALGLLDAYINVLKAKGTDPRAPVMRWLASFNAVTTIGAPGDPLVQLASEIYQQFSDPGEQSVSTSSGDTNSSSLDIVPGMLWFRSIIRLMAISPDPVRIRTLKLLAPFPDGGVVCPKDGRSITRYLEGVESLQRLLRGCCAHHLRSFDWSDEYPPECSVRDKYDEDNYEIEIFPPYGSIFRHAIAQIAERSPTNDPSATAKLSDAEKMRSDSFSLAKIAWDHLRWLRVNKAPYIRTGHRRVHLSALVIIFMMQAIDSTDFDAEVERLRLCIERGYQTHTRGLTGPRAPETPRSALERMLSAESASSINFNTLLMYRFVMEELFLDDIDKNFRLSLIFRRDDLRISLLEYLLNPGRTRALAGASVYSTSSADVKFSQYPENRLAQFEKFATTIFNQGRTTGLLETIAVSAREISDRALLRGISQISRRQAGTTTFTRLAKGDPDYISDRHKGGRDPDPSGRGESSADSDPRLSELKLMRYELDSDIINLAPINFSAGRGPNNLLGVFLEAASNISNADEFIFSRVKARHKIADDYSFQVIRGISAAELNCDSPLDLALLNERISTWVDDFCHDSRLGILLLSGTYRRPYLKIAARVGELIWMLGATTSALRMFQFLDILDAPLLATACSLDDSLANSVSEYKYRHWSRSALAGRSYRRYMRLLFDVIADSQSGSAEAALKREEYLSTAGDLLSINRRRLTMHFGDWFVIILGEARLSFLRGGDDGIFRARALLGEARRRFTSVNITQAAHSAFLLHAAKLGLDLCCNGVAVATYDVLHEKENFDCCSQEITTLLSSASRINMPLFKVEARILELRRDCCQRINEDYQRTAVQAIQPDGGYLDLRAEALEHEIKMTGYFAKLRDLAEIRKHIPK